MRRFDEEPLGNTGPHPGQQRLYADEFGHAVKSPRAKAKMEEEEQSFMQRYVRYHTVYGSFLIF